MKKIQTLILAAALTLGAAVSAQAIEFKAKGVWLTSMQYGQNGNFNSNKTGYDGSEDEFEARSRVRLQLDAVASKNLSGQVYFEIGKFIWGKAETKQGGAAMGADGSIVKVKRAYLDWVVPQTDLKVRMGIQAVRSPFTALDGPTVMTADVAGVTASYKFNDNVALTAFWARPYNDNYSNKNTNDSGFMDNMDIVGLHLPLTFDGIKVTPWGYYAAIGPNSIRQDDKRWQNGTNVFKPQLNGVDGKYYASGMFPLYANNKGINKGRQLTSYGNAWWAGVAGDLTIWDPFRIAWEFTYGSVEWDDNHALNRKGWMGALLMEYKMDWGVPGLYGWYASGDDDNPGNGSERMPYIVNDFGVSGFSCTFAGPGENGLERDRVIGNTLIGTWGVGARVKDVSFLDDLKHTFHVSLWGGTNSSGLLEKVNARTGQNFSAYSGSDFGRDNVYLTDKDYALEIGLTNKYKIYENLQFNLEGSYVKLFLDKGDGAWNRKVTGSGSNRTLKDAWNVSALLIYSF